MTLRDEQFLLAAPPAPFDEAALDRAADAIVALDSDLHVLSWNRAAAVLYGIAAEDLMGRRFTDAIICLHDEPRSSVPHSRDELDASDLRMAAAGLLDGPATHVVVASGRRVPVRVSVLPLHFQGDEKLHLLVIRDDAEQAQLAASLKDRLEFEMLLSELSVRFSNLAEEEVDDEIETWLSRLIAALDVDRSTFSQLKPDGLLVVTHSCTTGGVPAYPRGPSNGLMPWITGEFLAGRTVVMSRIPDDLPAEAMEERNYFVGVGMKAGIGIPIQICGAPLCVLTFGDFRRPRIWSDELVARLRLAGDAFGNAIARRTAKRRLEEKQLELVHVGRVAAMGELASVIAHELDQPLTVIVNNADSVRHALHSAAPELTGDADEALWEISDAAMRASEIVRRERQLLRKAPRSAEPVDLNDAIRETELFIRADARRFGAQLCLDVVPGLPAVLGDRVQLQQVVLNLAHNGLQAMRSQPSGSRTLCIRTQSGTSEVELTVSDSGPPVDPLLLRRMFEPFYTTKPDGLGMGLSISKSIIDRHRGRIWAIPNSGGGLAIHVCLPRK